ncbi:MAG: HNH endonuclease [Clostridia bacterium]|nr:HNH endonuclease [Clostridia bacterium]
MRIYMLFQDNSFAHERMGGYIWAPEKHFSDIGTYNWELVKAMHKGDVIYSVVDNRITSVNIATSEPRRRRKPTDLDIPAAGDGWYIDLNYSQLKRNILVLDNNKKDIIRLCSGRQAPYNEDGSIADGKIFEISYEAHKYVMNLVSTYNIAASFDLPELKESDIELVHQVENIVDKYEIKEHKALAVRMGMLETVLKQRLIRQTKKCALCDIDYSEFLSAVYIKPWSDSSTSERLDLNNLLLMCPLHRDMFESGLITFNSKGMIKISSEMRFENFKALSLNFFTSINMTKEQLGYMDWHNKKVFKE